MLKINNIEVKFHGSILVLSGVSLEIGEKDAVCLLGSNGAGKTTTLKAIAGVLHEEDGDVTHGFIEFDGKRIDKLRAEQIAGLGISLVWEERRVFQHLSVEENLLVGSSIRRGKEEGANLRRKFDIVYGYFPRLGDLRRRMAGYLSGGEQQMLVIGRGLMGYPKLMLLDEPSLGLSPILTDEIAVVINKIHDDGTAILIVEQNARLGMSVSQYGYVMETGKVVLDGPSDKLQDNEDIKQFYLGLSTLGRKSYRDVKHYKRRKRWL